MFIADAAPPQAGARSKSVAVAATLVACARPRIVPETGQAQAGSQPEFVAAATPLPAGPRPELIAKARLQPGGAQPAELPDVAPLRAGGAPLRPLQIAPGAAAQQQEVPPDCPPELAEVDGMVNIENQIIARLLS